MQPSTYQEIIALCSTCKTSYHAYEAPLDKWQTCDVCAGQFVIIAKTKTHSPIQKQYDKEEE